MTSATRTFSVPDISCDHCVKAITDHVAPLDGVEDVEVDLDTVTVTVTVAGGDDATIVSAIDDSG